MNKQSVLFKREPNWQLNNSDLRQHLSDIAQSWTYETGSLTQRLRLYYGNKVKVNVLLHDWRVPFISEQQLLKQTPKQFCLVREVLLYVDTMPLILARSIIPNETLQIARDNLLHLGNRPIGEIIFAFPNLISHLNDLSVISTNLWTEKTHELVTINEPLNGRRCVHQLAEKELIISEFFLPNLLIQSELNGF